jgi:hypothetical protein
MAETNSNIKFKITITTTVEYEVNPKNYPHGNNLEEMLQCDIKNAEDDPYLMMEMGEAKTNTVVKGEIVER